MENLIFSVKVAKIVNSLKNVSIFVVCPFLLGVGGKNVAKILNAEKMEPAKRRLDARNSTLENFVTMARVNLRGRRFFLP